MYLCMRGMAPYRACLFVSGKGNCQPCTCGEAPHLKVVRCQTKLFHTCTFFFHTQFLLQVRDLSKKNATTLRSITVEYRNNLPHNIKCLTRLMVAKVKSAGLCSRWDRSARTIGYLYQLLSRFLPVEPCASYGGPQHPTTFAIFDNSQSPNKHTIRLCV